LKYEENIASLRDMSRSDQDDSFGKGVKNSDSIRYNCVRYRVECVTGTDLFLSRDIVEKVGGLFDSVIFMYNEESEL